MRQPTSYLQLKNYFADLVKQSNFINDFVGYFVRELHNKQSSFSGVGFPCLALFGYSINVEGEEMASSSVRSMNFGILIGDVDPADYERQYEAIDRGEKLAEKVVARMKLDSNNEQHFLYGALIKNSVEIRPVDMEGVGLFGAEVSFKLKNYQSFKVLLEDWKDVEKIC